MSNYPPGWRGHPALDAPERDECDECGRISDDIEWVGDGTESGEGDCLCPCCRGVCTKTIAQLSQQVERLREALNVACTLPALTAGVIHAHKRGDTGESLTLNQRVSDINGQLAAALKDTEPKP